MDTAAVVSREAALPTSPELQLDQVHHHGHSQPGSVDELTDPELHADASVHHVRGQDSQRQEQPAEWGKLPRCVSRQRPDAAAAAPDASVGVLPAGDATAAGAGNQPGSSSASPPERHTRRRGSRDHPSPSSSRRGSRDGQQQHHQRPHDREAGGDTRTSNASGTVGGSSGPDSDVGDESAPQPQRRLSAAGRRSRSGRRSARLHSREELVDDGYGGDGGDHSPGGPDTSGEDSGEDICNKGSSPACGGSGSKSRRQGGNAGVREGEKVADAATSQDWQSTQSPEGGIEHDVEEEDFEREVTVVVRRARGPAKPASKRRPASRRNVMEPDASVAAGMASLHIT